MFLVSGSNFNPLSSIEIEKIARLLFLQRPPHYEKVHAQKQQSLRDGSKVDFISTASTLFPARNYEGGEEMGALLNPISLYSCEKMSING